MKKAQSSVEFMIVISAMLILFVIFSFAIYSQISDETKEKRNAEVNELAINIQNEITLASSASSGYQRKFSVPEKIIGLEYTIELTQGLVYIKTINNKHALALPIQSVTGNIQIGQNTIRKSGTTVYLNE